MIITLPWQVLSNQHIYGQNGHIKFMKAEAKVLKNYRETVARMQWGEETLKWDVYMRITYFHKDKRSRDIDNFWKLVLDSLSWIVYEDDKQIVQLHLEKKLDKENPRVEVFIHWHDEECERS